MKDSIYTIPISEVFEPKTGCPLCTLQRTLELRWIQYITGAAMMEPDVRERTNQEGFCSRHLHQMLEQRNRLSVALLLQTRLEYLLEHPEERSVSGLFAKREREPRACFICERVEQEMLRLMDNLVTVWVREEDFRRLYGEQEHLCHPHAKGLLQASSIMRGKDRPLFRQETARLTRKGLVAAKADIDDFCKLFDHRSSHSGPAPDRVATSIEAAGDLLCGHTFQSQNR